MLYTGSINFQKVRSIKSAKLEKKEVTKFVDIDDELLREKDSWYRVSSDNVSFFKARNDARLFGECLSQEIFEKMGIESAQYEIVLLNKQLGLLTPNFQNLEENHYFDLFNLYKVLPYLNKGYNNFTLKNLLDNIAYQGWINQALLIQEIIDRYVGEWVTHQTDGNPRNILFAYSKNTGILSLAPSFDRERCFGIDGDFDSHISNNIWVPSIPYEDINFKENPYEADDGVDANILGLYLDYPEETIKAFEKVFGVDYESIFKKYNKNLYQFMLPNETINYLCDIIDKKDSQKKKILSL